MNIDHLTVDSLGVEDKRFGEGARQVGQVHHKPSDIRRVLLHPRVFIRTNNIVCSRMVYAWHILISIGVDRIGEDVIIMNGT